MLAQDYAHTTISAHLSTVRSRYRDLLRDNTLRQDLLTLAGKKSGVSAADRKAMVDEVMQRIRNAVDPEAAPVTVRTQQDRPDSSFIRLTPNQANALLAAPGADSVRGLRDTAIIALMLCTGIREAELCNVEAQDLRRKLGGELALHVREGKGCKERLVPYGDLDWVLVVLDRWRRDLAEVAKVTKGPIFRGFYKGYKTAQPGPLSVRAVEYIVGRYPVAIDGNSVRVTPHDLRRTYARLMYDAGMELVAIQQNLGHADIKTTLSYIGELEADKRRGRPVLSFDLSALEA